MEYQIFGTMKNHFSWKPLVVVEVAVILLMALPSCNSGNILVIPVDGSHWVNMKVLMEELQLKGHIMTVIRGSNTMYIAERSPLYTTITIPVHGNITEDFFHEFLEKMLEVQRGDKYLIKFLKLQRDFLSMLSEVHRFSCEMFSDMLENTELVKRLQEAQYDLVLTDPVMAGGVVLAHYLKLPLVLNVRWIPSGEGHSALAPTPLSYIPSPGSGFSDRMSFTERVINILYYGIILFQQRFMIGPHYQALCDRYFESSCDIETLIQSADIWLMRADFVFEFPRPTMPNVVYMGGFQCKPPKALPEDLEEFVQSSGEHGVILMSLGTLVNSLPSDICDEIAFVFATLPQKVIWRHLGNRPSMLGNNTLIVNWMPQSDLLGHSKVKAFVAHGGTNGVQEAIYHGVPVLGIPLFFDQYDNLLRLKEKGAAKILDIATLERGIFSSAIQEILHNPSYRLNMQRLSRLHRDQPNKPLDSAIFWIEYVMRHKGAAHLRSESYKLPWYAYHSVDVIATLLAVPLLLLLTIIGVIRYCCCRVYKIKSE
ncbi:UDP-glucuronosyltransferase 2C1-like isoform X2 [Brienomyrus brachyistius]|uniref:UDP-glucuronosyltransferase 2C1-like isoform X1 n=2 Tax=Brienomyrus brachyistius TaxID=42636 RepID=UPI0020B44C2D|nr:UDP-glucuronosyltransferase 2C1-like isoform X1 [Brienomyrus brachyistius]XP_048886210.1 UDP-glucuronosyltransferase 2C1-like isoform X2 [Brienomyrus brachyistius]